MENYERAENVLPDGIELVYLDYRDELPDSAVAAIVRGDMETVWDDSFEWFSEAEHIAAWDIAIEAVESAGMIRECDAWNRTVAELADMGFGPDDIFSDDDMQSLVDRVYELRTDDPVSELIDRHGRVLIRFSTGIELSAGSSVAHIAAILRDDPAISGNYWQAARVIQDCASELWEEYAPILHCLAAVELSDLSAFCEPAAPVAVSGVAPFLTTFDGAGFATYHDLGITVTVSRSDIATDDEAPGYSWSDHVGDPASYIASHLPDGTVIVRP